ncbi:hypothetical protein THAOC_36208 [Thalassiosira oceanica]|uniref:Uncharacterized protein n=1 Tax=Thalassiosira oceanica TaxID=159749 RepID=K0R272_THAOC|nr:hypothetical protein THAOC_36208 [Thalassiosira oceanica]|eukprot:EJK45189.1 hypothetical protein THAOC_36208 [Thalassiosira oceanica]
MPWDWEIPRQSAADDDNPAEEDPGGGKCMQQQIAASSLVGREIVAEVDGKEEDGEWDGDEGSRDTFGLSWECEPYQGGVVGSNHSRMEVSRITATLPSVDHTAALQSVDPTAAMSSEKDQSNQDEPLDPAPVVETARRGRRKTRGVRNAMLLALAVAVILAVGLALGMVRAGRPADHRQRRRRRERERKRKRKRRGRRRPPGRAVGVRRPRAQPVHQAPEPPRPRPLGPTELAVLGRFVSGNPSLRILALRACLGRSDGHPARGRDRRVDVDHPWPVARSSPSAALEYLDLSSNGLSGSDLSGTPRRATGVVRAVPRPVVEQSRGRGQPRHRRAREHPRAGRHEAPGRQGGGQRNRPAGGRSRSSSPSVATRPSEDSTSGRTPSGPGTGLGAVHAMMTARAEACGNADGMGFVGGTFRWGAVADECRESRE